MGPVIGKEKKGGKKKKLLQLYKALSYQLTLRTCCDSFDVLSVSRINGWKVGVQRDNQS